MSGRIGAGSRHAAAGPPGRKTVVPNKGECFCWGYQDTVNIRGRQIVLKYDRLMRESGDFTLAAQANDELCAMAKEESTQILNKVLRTASEQMKNGFSFADTCVNK